MFSNPPIDLENVDEEDEESQDNDDMNQTKGREGFNENGAVYHLQDESASENEQPLRNQGTTPLRKNLLEDDADMVLSAPGKSPNKKGFSSMKTPQSSSPNKSGQKTSAVT